MQGERPHRSYVASVLECRCPRCREGKLFKFPLTLRLERLMQMNERCPVCGQATEIEVGFYYGTSYVSYLLAIIISAITLILWWIIIGFSFSDNRFFYWIGFNAFLLIVMQPWLMRFSRSLWISWFVKYDPQWPEKQPESYERINKDQMNNW
ncbi:MAG: DUF983 domain-containing protein [Chitinophagaceae bacterium]